MSDVGVERSAASKPAAAPSMTARTASGAIAGSVVAQGLSSGTNFLVLVLAARQLSVVDFGAFSLVFGVVIVLLGATRPIALEALLVHREDARDGPAAAERSAVGLALICGLFVAVGLGVASLVASGGTAEAFGVSALFAPALFVQDALRYVQFARRRPLAAGGLDAVWLVLVVVVLLSGRSLGVGGAAAVWGLGAAASAGAGIAMLRLVPDVRRAFGWLRETSHLAGPYLGEFMVAAGATQVAAVVLAGIAGLAAVGALRAGLAIYGPVNVVFTGGFLIMVPHARDVLRDHKRTALRLFAGFSVSFSLIATAWMFAVTFAPDRLGRSLLGDSWDEAREVVVPLGLSYIVAGVTTGAVLAIRGARLAKWSLKVRLIALPADALPPIIGAEVDGARGFAIGMVIGAAFVAVVWWQAAWRAVFMRRPAHASP